MAEKYPLSDTLTGRERDILAQKKLGAARLGYAQDTGKLMFYEGTKWIGAESEYVTQWSSSSSASSRSSSSSSMSSSSSRSSSSSSSSMSSSSISSSSSAKRIIYPDTPILNQKVDTTIDESQIDIYTVINIEANISQVFNMEVGVFEIELTGLFVYTGGLSDLTTQGQYIPLEGSYAFSVASTGVEPEFMMSLATKFMTSLETEKKTITIADKDYQRIIFEPLFQAHVLDTYTLQGSATSGLPITYISSDTSIATVSGNTLTFLTDGEVDITATQAGDANYEAAESVTHKLIVKPRIVTRQAVKTGTGYTGVRILTPFHTYTDYTLSYWMKPTLGPTASDYDVYLYEGNSALYFRIYGDGSASIAGSGHTANGMGRFDTAQNYYGNAIYEPIYHHADKWSATISPGTYTSDEWHHVAWVRSLADASVTHYVNGDKVATYQGNLVYNGFTDPNFNGTYTVLTYGQSHTVYTTDNKNVTPTWKPIYAGGILDHDDLRINGKPFFIRRKSTGGTYEAYAAIFWDDVNNRWVLTDSPSHHTSGTLPAELVINEPNANKVMYTDNLALGFTTGTNGWLGADSGVAGGGGGDTGAVFKSLGASLSSGAQYTTDAEKRIISKDENDLTFSTGSGLFIGAAYANDAVKYPRDITEIAMWKETVLTSAEIQTIYNEGHSNYSGPDFSGLNPNIMGIQGGPVAYYRGGMDDFLSSVGIRNVGAPHQSHQVVDDAVALGIEASLIKYEP